MCILNTNMPGSQARQIMLYISDYGKYKNNFLSKTNCAIHV